MNDTNNSSVAAMTFADLGLNENILREIEKLGYKTPTPIQVQAIPHILDRRDILGQAQTGTGKTAAFALPILNNLLDSKTDSRCPEVLVLAPTRELALQVSENFELFSKSYKQLSIVSIYGGQDYTKQIRALNSGVNIVVGTTGRVIDHINRKTLRLDNIKTIVLDEADEMLRMGFVDDIKMIMSLAPANCQRLLFSATMPRDILDIVDDYLQNPVKIHVKSKTNTASTVKQCYIVVRGMSKIEALDRVLSNETSDGIIIFVRTKNETTEIATELQKLGYNAAAMSGDMSQGQRELIIDHLKAGKVKILIATDVVARGLDVDCISHVINYELPQDSEAYVHRIGRTGRAGREGTAISLLTPREFRLLSSVERSIKQTLQEATLPTGSDITKKRINDLKNSLNTAMNSSATAKYDAVANDILSEMADIDHNKIFAAILSLMYKEKNLFVEDVVSSGNYDRGGYSGKSNFTSNDRWNKGGNSRGGYDRDSRQTRGGGDRYEKSDRFERGGERRTSNYEDRSSSFSAADFITYKIDIGAQNGIMVKNIVGALANEGGIPGPQIKNVKVFDDYSLFSLPKTLSSSAIQKIKGLRIANNRINVKELN